MVASTGRPAGPGHSKTMLRTAFNTRMSWCVGVLRMPNAATYRATITRRRETLSYGRHRFGSVHRSRVSALPAGSVVPLGPS